MAWWVVGSWRRWGWEEGQSTVGAGVAACFVFTEASMRLAIFRGRSRLGGWHRSWRSGRTPCSASQRRASLEGDPAKAILDRSDRSQRRSRSTWSHSPSRRAAGRRGRRGRRHSGHLGIPDDLRPGGGADEAGAGAGVPRGGSEGIARPGIALGSARAPSWAARRGGAAGGAGGEGAVGDYAERAGGAVRRAARRPRSAAPAAQRDAAVARQGVRAGLHVAGAATDRRARRRRGTPDRAQLPPRSKRDRILLAEGWRSARVTWAQLRDEPEAVASDFREALAGRG